MLASYVAEPVGVQNAVITLERLEIVYQLTVVSGFMYSLWFCGVDTTG